MIISNYFYILRLLETPGVGVAKVRKIINMADEFNIDISEIANDFKLLKKYLNETQINAFMSNTRNIQELWDRLMNNNIEFLLINEDDYPDLLRVRLGEKAPPLLTIFGNKSLLEKPSVGFCGSRRASSKGIETARDCAQQLSMARLNIVSGYAAGIDMATHCAALEAGGTTTIVLAEGILNFRIKKEIKDLFDLDKVLVISEVLPGVTWSVRNAMQRNKTIISLSLAMILIESGINGGSMAAGKACLNLEIPLFAPIYEGMPSSAIGNQKLLNEGAHPLLKSRKLNKANLTNVFAILEGKNKRDEIPSNKKMNCRLWEA
jgi:predicted Rossmann fold nucleotide-binding protein DprA/Smf involved in DNA uptake